MDSRAILALYRWTPDDDCFRCARGSVPTAGVHQIDTPLGEHYDIRACEACVLDLEEERRQHADHAGLEYKPGHLSRGEA